MSEGNRKPEPLDELRYCLDRDIVGFALLRVWLDNCDTFIRRPTQTLTTQEELIQARAALLITKIHEAQQLTQDLLSTVLAMGLSIPMVCTQNDKVVDAALIRIVAESREKRNRIVTNNFDVAQIAPIGANEEGQVGWKDAD